MKTYFGRKTLDNGNNLEINIKREKIKINFNSE